jgi:hypothetical protein
MSPIIEMKYLPVSEKTDLNKLACPSKYMDNNCQNRIKYAKMTKKSGAIMRSTSDFGEFSIPIYSLDSSGKK